MSSLFPDIKAFIQQEFWVQFGGSSIERGRP
jgi:hypothetical protein